jgi:hypothetical protein
MLKFWGLVLGALVLLPFSCGGSGGGANAACHQQDNQACDKAYNCVAAADRDTAFTDQYGTSPAECKGANADADCKDAATLCPKLNATLAATCLSKVGAFTCAQFLDPATPQPAECGQMCGP